LFPERSLDAYHNKVAIMRKYRANLVQPMPEFVYGIYRWTTGFRGTTVPTVATGIA